MIFTDSECKIIDKYVMPFFQKIVNFFMKKIFEHQKIKEMQEFITILANDSNKIKQLQEIMDMPNMGNNLMKKLGNSKEDAEKIMFIRYLGPKPNLEQWLMQNWSFSLNTYYISISPLFYKAYTKWKKCLK